MCILIIIIMSGSPSAKRAKKNFPLVLEPECETEEFIALMATAYKAASPFPFVSHFAFLIENYSLEIGRYIHK